MHSLHEAVVWSTLEGGVYQVGEKLLEHARVGYTVKHPATLGAQLADAFAKRVRRRGICGKSTRCR